MPAPPKDASYRKAIVTFIDVLGFGRMLETASAADVAKTLRRMYFAGDAHEPAGENADRGLHVVAFSDSIVRTRDLEELHGAFFMELLGLVHMQAGLTDLGVFIRGGMSFGKVYADGTTVFGPAMAAAYHLESKRAKYGSS